MIWGIARRWRMGERDRGWMKRDKERAKGKRQREWWCSGAVVVVVVVLLVVVVV